MYGYAYDAYLYANNQGELQKKFEETDVKIVRRLSMTDYQNKELVIEDIDGRWIAYGLKEK